jgi:hypothetical protein
MDRDFVEATRELCDDLDSLLELANLRRVSIRALSLIERARADLQTHLDEIDRLRPQQAGLIGLTNQTIRPARRTEGAALPSRMRSLGAPAV